MPVLPCPGDDGRGAHGVGWPSVSPPWGLSMEYLEIFGSVVGDFENSEQDICKPIFRK